MSAVNHGRVRQGEKLGLYRRHERGCIATRQIGTTHRAVEENVAAEDHALPEKADAPGRVPRRKPHRELESADVHNLPRPKLPVWGRRAVELESHPRSILRQRIVERTIEGVKTDRGAGCGVHSLHTHDVIYMTVGKPDLT